MKNKSLEILELKAYGKINLFLDVVGRRVDGYHFIRSKMQDIEIYDEIIFKRGIKSSNNHCNFFDIELEFCMKNSTIPCNDDNLAIKGAKKVLEKISSKGVELPKDVLGSGINIEINKNIPISAGLAGGSADASVCMLGINELLDNPLSLEELMRAGIEVGSDVPFSIMMNFEANKDILTIAGEASKAGIISGVGEIVSPIETEKYELILMNPGISVSTKRIYDEIDKRFSFKKEDYDSEKTRADIFFAKNNNKYNIMQVITLDLYDEAKEIYDYMKQNLSADTVMMSGSGPTMVAYYLDKEIADIDFIKAEREASEHEGWKVFRTVSGR